MGQQLITEVGCFTTSTKDKINDNFTEVYANSGTPGGSDTQVQFNDAGAFGGATSLTWDKTNSSLTISDENTPAEFPLMQIRTPSAFDDFDYVSMQVVNGGDNLGDLLFLESRSTAGHDPLLPLEVGGNYTLGDGDSLSIPTQLLKVSANSLGTGQFGTITNLDVLPSVLQNVTTYQSIRLRTPNSTTNVTNAYGLKIENQTVAGSTINRAIDVNGKFFMAGDGSQVVMIPATADPHIVGAIWNNAGTLTISAG